MKKIPVPVVVIVVLLALVAAAWSIKRSTGAASNVPIPTGPPNAEAMQHMRDYSSRGRAGGVVGGPPQGAMGRQGGMMSGGR